MRFLFRIGKGEWVYKLFGVVFSRGKAPNFFKGYTFNKNDIVVACLARSGTHWMMQIALQIAHLGQADYDYVYDIVPWTDFLLPDASIKLNEPVPPSATGYRVIKTHQLARDLCISDSAKYITVIRDPKEFLVSMYHFAPQAFAFMGIDPGTPEYWLEKFFKKQIPGGWWVEHTAGWWVLRDKPNVYVVPFNLLKADSKGQIDRISEFLGVKLTPEQREQVIEKSSFEYMKAINHKFSPIIGNTGMIDIVRRGKTNTGHELFTEEQLARVDAYCTTELKRLGSDFPYSEYFVRKT